MLKMSHAQGAGRSMPVHHWMKADPKGPAQAPWVTLVIARRALVWQTFKNRCPSVRARPSAYASAYVRIFWQIMQGVQRPWHDFWVHILRQNIKKWKVENPKRDLIPCNRDHIKFFWRKNKKRFAKYIWPKNQNFSQVGPYAQCKNKNVQLFEDGKSWSTPDWRRSNVFHTKALRATLALRV